MSLPFSSDARQRGSSFDDAQDFPAPLGRLEASAVLSRVQPVSLIKVAGVQILVGFVCAVLVGLLFQNRTTVLSALCAVLVVALPSMVFACGYRKARVKKNFIPQVAFTSFMVWELLKIALSVVLMFAVVLFVPDLNWPVFLIVMLVCLKSYGVALIVFGVQLGRIGRKS